MRSTKVQGFASGVQNKIPADIIAPDAASDALSWLSIDGAIELFRGRTAVGAEGALGKIYGEIIAPKMDGTQVHFRKAGTKIQYLNGTTWTDIVTGLTEDEDYTFAPYISQAGAYVFVGGADGLYKIATANPGSYKSMYDSAINHYGKILINEQRMFLWDRRDGKPDSNALYLSKIDPQGTNYGTVTNEVIETGDGVTTSFSGTLAEATGKRFVFGLQINTNPASVTASDDYVGIISGSGVTGTINYATGAYTLTFTAAPANLTQIRCSYQYEDSNVDGITDFTFTSPNRQAGEGDIIPQEYLGEPIQAVFVFEGKYYSFKKTCVYELDLTIDDTNATNTVFRKDIGMPSLRAGVSTGKGIVFINTANPSKPELTILFRNPVGGNLEPVNLTPLFAWENYEFDDASLDTWDEFVIMSAKTPDSNYNDRIFLINPNQKYSVDIGYYGFRTTGKDNTGNLYVGDGLTETVYQIFSGYDDMANVVENYFDTREETYKSDDLKRFRFLRLKGLINTSQYFEVYASFDNGDWQLVGTIRGDSSYVDLASSVAIGNNSLGTSSLGGTNNVTTNAYQYFAQIRMRCPKFRTRKLRFVAQGIGYVNINFIQDMDILMYEQKLPRRFRQQQWVSLDGTQTNLPNVDDV